LVKLQNTVLIIYTSIPAPNMARPSAIWILLSILSIP